mmetsp:Transcript_10885/g.30561  ORF Transcript_10885/g.30561 Transcript_10885/m.30561 type:complete len:311 (-) Transcript_10885:628-1560(-)|eukprot:CAMPEP_0119127128 /NCGR_PEP_ID=MMETSP1310-20130426/5788_1 /TAXON_ID=464262 /ORGANISM="Genus nov. species nov., Strain RCC2339" /LENGTH=310 /DNA_ID=CAMNT_0007117353 /DNA_START=44 /DNA_END=976 /DNA_ORIENTATION=-
MSMAMPLEPILWLLIIVLLVAICAVLVVKKVAPWHAERKEEWIVRFFPNLTNSGSLLEYTCDNLYHRGFSVQSRRFLLYIPPSLCNEETLAIDESAANLPVVVLFHPRLYTAYAFFRKCEQEGEASWQAVAEREGFLLVFLEAVNRPVRSSPILKKPPLWELDDYDTSYIRRSLRHLTRTQKAVDDRSMFGIVYDSDGETSTQHMFAAAACDAFAAVLAAVAYRSLADDHQDGVGSRGGVRLWHDIVEELSRRQAGKAKDRVCPFLLALPQNTIAPQALRAHDHLLLKLLDNQGVSPLLAKEFWAHLRLY